ncbi:MAG: helix-turn-helix domain-containing protein [Bacillota bacterium]
MRINELVEKLEKAIGNIDHYIIDNHNIIRIRFLVSEQKEFESNTLYVGKAILYPIPGPVPSDASIALVSDQKLPEEYRDHGTGNLICIRSEKDLFDVFNQIQDIYQDSSRLLDGSASLLECIIRGKEIREVIETGYEILNNPIMLMDTSYKVLSYKTDTTVNDEVWNDLVTRGYSSYKYVTKFKYERIIEKILRNDDPIILDTGVAEKIRRILGKIQVNDKCMGYLAILEYKQSFQSQDLKIAKLICEVISSIMKEDKWQKNAIGLMWENLIQDLLEGRVIEASELNDRLQSSEWVPGKNMCMVSVDMSRFNDPSFIDYFRLQIHKLVPQCRSIYYNNAVSIIIEFGDAATYEIHISSIISFLKENGLHAGCSESFSDLFDIGRYYNQSRKALFFGELMDPKKWMAKYKNYVLNDFVYDASRNLDIKSFCHEGVLKLHEYDKSNSTEYYRTLYEYLKNDKNVIATSEALFIHRNTVNYRLEKIKELLGIRLRETEETIHILITYKMMEIMEITEIIFRQT